MQAGVYGIGPGIGGTDNHGNPVNVSVATAITYDLCLKACGPGQEPFSWNIFSQQFGAWLLPWLALVSQLPFGANDNLDNLVSVLLTLGSPTLAAYSLILTVLNARWINRRFLGFTYPNVRNAVRILGSLQQAPLEIDTDLLASLIVLPQNDGWWSELNEGIDYTYTWSISAVASIIWVLIAFVFTLVDSYTGGITMAINANGQGVGSLWLWLLPIVVGWLQLSPKCDSIRLLTAIERANRIAYVATEDGDPVHIKYAESEARAFELSLLDLDHLRNDEKRTVPIYNYARLFTWVQAVETVSEAFEAASHRYHNHQSVNPSIKWVTVEKGEKPDPTNRVGTRSQVEGYCDLQHDSKRFRSHWGPQCISRICVSSFFALLLQWGTAGAAMVVAWFTPTQGELEHWHYGSPPLLITFPGLGCRTASYLLYGILSTIVWILLLTSSILTHYCAARTSDGRIIHDWSRRAARFWSITLRRLGKVIAAGNAVWIVLACLFQFASFYDRCFCNSSVFSLRSHAYNVINLVADDISSLRTAWISGFCLAAASSSIYSLVVGLLINPDS